VKALRMCDGALARRKGGGGLRCGRRRHGSTTVSAGPYTSQCQLLSVLAYNPAQPCNNSIEHHLLDLPHELLQRRTCTVVAPQSRRKSAGVGRGRTTHRTS
jgi:hypothetical protein